MKVEKMIPAPSLQLSLSGAVIRALRLSFAVLDNANAYAYHGINSSDSDLSTSNAFLSELRDLYNELTVPEHLSNTQHDSWKKLLVLTTKIQRVAGDLIVHLEDSQQVDGKHQQSSELKPKFHGVWTEEDREALNRRLSGLKDILVDEIVPTLK